MSLRDSILGLRNAARSLNAATFNPEMNALKILADNLGDKIFSCDPPEDFLKKLLEKFLRGEKNFTRREFKALPFIIFEGAINFEDTKKILNMLNLSDKRHLSGLIKVYLNHYDGSNKTELLRRRINFIPKEFAEGSTRLKKIFASKDKLFADNRMANMENFFAQKLSVADSLEELGLTNFYKASNFIQTALIIFFQTNTPPAAQFKILAELDSEFDTYKNIFPYIADALIQTVYRTGYGKNKCMEIFYRRLGDPRFGNSRFNWDKVSPKSRDIFSQWLSAEDLEIFFELINQTAVNRMWRYREKFWRAYLPHISSTWIFLGSDAKRIARQLGDKNTGHGNLDGGVRDQSVFVFQIKNFIFLEWSHNGKLSVYKSETTNLFFGLPSLRGINITSNVIKDWVHSSPKTYSWQKKVSEWLKTNCGIDKTEKDWRLEN